MIFIEENFLEKKNSSNHVVGSRYFTIFESILLLLLLIKQYFSFGDIQGHLLSRTVVTKRQGPRYHLESGEANNLKMNRFLDKELKLL